MSAISTPTLSTAQPKTDAKKGHPIMAIFFVLGFFALGIGAALHPSLLWIVAAFRLLVGLLVGLRLGLVALLCLRAVFSASSTWGVKFRLLGTGTLMGLAGLIIALYSFIPLAELMSGSSN